MTWALACAYVPQEQNAGWQAMNKAIGVTFNFDTPTASDYQQKLNAVIASGALPDLMYKVQANVPKASDFMRGFCAYLTPYLPGDAAKEYPNLANLPTYSWLQTAFDQAIYAVPVARAPFASVWVIRQDLIDATGVPLPKNAADLKRFLVRLKDPSRNQYAVGEQASAAPGMSLMSPIFRCPNNWRLEPSGTLTNDFETAEYAAAVAYCRDLWGAGVFHPNSLSNNANQQADDFTAGRIVSYSNTWASYLLRASTVSLPVRVMEPFAFDGGNAVYFLGPGNFGITFVKRADPERVKLMLHLMNFIAAPFGSTEFLLQKYGVERLCGARGESCALAARY